MPCGYASLNERLIVTRRAHSVSYRPGVKKLGRCRLRVASESCFASNVGTCICIGGLDGLAEPAAGTSRPRRFRALLPLSQTLGVIATTTRC